MPNKHNLLIILSLLPTLAAAFCLKAPDSLKIHMLFDTYSGAQYTQRNAKNENSRLLVHWAAGFELPVDNAELSAQIAYRSPDDNASIYLRKVRVLYQFKPGWWGGDSLGQVGHGRARLFNLFVNHPWYDRAINQDYSYAGALLSYNKNFRAIIGGNEWNTGLADFSGSYTVGPFTAGTWLFYTARDQDFNRTMLQPGIELGYSTPGLYLNLLAYRQEFGSTAIDEAFSTFTWFAQMDWRLSSNINMLAAWRWYNPSHNVLANRQDGGAGFTVKAGQWQFNPAFMLYAYDYSYDLNPRLNVEYQLFNGFYCGLAGEWFNPAIGSNVWQVGIQTRSLIEW